MKKIVPIIFAAAFMLSGCSNSNTSKEIINTATAPKEAYIFAGKVEANDSVNLLSKISAKVTGINGDIGTVVKEGDPIIYLDSADTEAGIKRAEAAVNTARASLAKIQSGARPEQIESAQAAKESAEKLFENAQNNYNRTKQLYDGGYVPKQDMETVEAQLTSAKSQVTSSQQQLNMLASGETKETINVAESQVKEAEASLNSAKTQLSNVIITSPISGTITSKNISVGELANPGQALFTIVNDKQLHVDSYVPVDMVSQLSIGQKVMIKVSELNDKKLEGEITLINSEVDQKSKNILVKVSIKDDVGLLKPGMFAEVGLKK